MSTKLHSQPVTIAISGVQITDFMPTSTATPSQSSFLDRLTAYRSTLFLRRIRFLAEENGDCPIRFQPSTKETVDRIIWAELQVLREYFASFEDVWEYLRNDVSMVRWIQES